MGLIRSHVVLPASGRVTLTERDPSGRVVRVQHADNDFCDAMADLFAQQLSNYAQPSLLLSHVSLGAGGADIDQGQSVAGWTGAVSLDTTNYTIGTASLAVSASASAKVSVSNAAVCAARDATGASIELAVRAQNLGAFDATQTVLYLYTGSLSNGYSITLAAMQAASGTQLVESSFGLQRIPLSAFTPFGTPTPSAITGYGWDVTATAAGAVRLNWDDVRVYPAVLPTTHVVTSVQNERTKVAVSGLAYASPGRVTATAFWAAGTGLGTFYIAGLWAASGGALAAIVPISYTKQPNYSLTVSWTLTFTGG